MACAAEEFPRPRNYGTVRRARLWPSALLLLLLLLLTTPAQAAEPFHPRTEALDVYGLNQACGTAVDNKGDLYLSSAGDDEIRVYDPAHELLTSIEDTNTPCGLAVTSTGNLYVSERATGEVVRFKPNAYPFAGTPTYGAREPIDTTGEAQGIAVDPFDDRLYVAEGERVAIYSSAGVRGANERQRVNITGTSGGTFKLSFEAQQSTALPYNASAEEVAKALEALSAIGKDNVSVEKTLESRWFVNFVGALAHKDVPLLEADGSELTGSGPAIAVTEPTKGWSGTVGEGLLIEASGVAPYTAEPESFVPEHYLWVADKAGLGADRLLRFGGKTVEALALQIETTGANTPAGSFEFGEAGAYLAADPGNLKAKKCTIVAAQACTAGRLYLYDAGHEVLEELDGSGEYLDQIENAAFADAEPSAVALDRSGTSSDGELYVTAGAGEGAKALSFAPLDQPAPKTLSTPISKELATAAAVAVDANGYLYAAAGPQVHIYKPDGSEILTEAKAPIEDKAGSPEDLAVDSQCNVYVLEGEAKATYYAPSACPPVAGTTFTRHEPLLAESKGFPEEQKLKALAVNPGPAAGKDRLFVTSVKYTREYASAKEGSGLLDSEFAPGLTAGVIPGFRESVDVNGNNGNVYFGVNPQLIYVVDAEGKLLTRIDTKASAVAKTGLVPALAVEQSSGHAVEYDGKTKTVHEYEAITGAFVAEYGNFTEGLFKPYRVAVDNSCAINGLSGEECEELYPRDGTVYVAFDDTSASHPPYDVTAFGPLSYAKPAKHKLTVKKTGKGSGTVIGEEEEEGKPIIDCGSKCSAEIDENKVVKLTAKAAEVPLSEFEGWTGCDSEPSEVECWVTPSKDKEVTAKFETEELDKTLEVILGGPGTGKVTSEPEGIECPPTCEAKFPASGTVLLTASADKGSEVAVWTGCDSEPLPTECEVAMNGEDHTVELEFGPEHPLLTVVKEGNGQGTVTSEDEAIDCGPTCTHKYELGDMVTLEAKAAPGSAFVGWEGCDSESEPEPGVLCEVEMDEPKEATATFSLLPSVKAKPAQPLFYDEATLRGEIDPTGQATEYRFEYLTEAEYKANGDSFEGIAIQTPIEELGAGEGPEEVAARLFGLKEGTTYRFALRAMSSVGEAFEEGSFATLKHRPPETCPNSEYRTGFSVALPDCRVYELTTPAQTNGLKPSAMIDGGTSSGSFSNWFTAQHGPEAGEDVSYFTEGTLPGFEGNGILDAYRAERAPGAHPEEGWQSTSFSPVYSEAAPGKPDQQGIGPDQLFSVWFLRSDNKESIETLPPGQYLSTPSGFEPFAQGSEGTDLEALSRYVSAGGEHVIFSSTKHLEENAAPEGTATLYDRKAGAESAEVISLKPDGSAFGTGEGASYAGATEDGSAVVFNAAGALYLHRAGKTTQIAGGTSSFAGISADGTKVFYSTSGTEAGGLYLCDTQAGPCAGTEKTHERTEIAAAGILASVPEEGTGAFFSSTEALTGSEDNDNEETAIKGKRNLYAWDGEEVRFVARLAEQDFANQGFAGIAGMNLAAWTRALMTGLEGGRSLAPTRSTPEGAVFVFQSHARLTAFDNEGVGEIYRYAPAAKEGERLLCVSCAPSGSPSTEDALLTDTRAPFATTTRRTMIANLTEDGTRVFFQSADQLLPEDANDRIDVYEWMANGASGCESPKGCLALISSGQGEGDSYLYAMSPDGRDVFFTTRDKLVGADVVGSPSIYDARSGGGIPEPLPPAACEGDSCQRPPTESPALPTPFTTAPAEGPVKEAKTKRCKKPKRRVKGRCVRVKKHHKRRHHKRRHRARTKQGGQR